MKKRTASSQPTSNTSAQSFRGSNLQGATPQNYLHILKQTSVTNKNSKKITLTKPESLSSSLRAIDLRPPSVEKTASGPRTSQRLGSMQASFTFAPQTQKTPLYQPLSVKGSVPRNLSEPKFKKGIIEQLQASNQPSLNGSLHGLDSVPQSNQGSMVDISSPESKKTMLKNNFITGPELMATATSTNEKHHNEHGLTSSTGQTRMDSQNSSQKFSAQVRLQKQVAPFTSDFLNESLETDKSVDMQPKEGDDCMNHRGKRAKYYTNCEEDPLVQYKLCSKCAVALADKGAKVREIINSEEELRKSEIEAFLIKLSHSRRNTKMIFESISSKKLDFVEFFHKQNEKADAIRSVLEKMIKEEFDHVKKRFESHRAKIMSAFEAIETQLNGNLKEVANMQSDIEQNLENILKCIEIKPFQKIIGAYHERIHELDQHLEVIRAQKINVEKLPGFKPKELQDFKPRIQGLFELRELQTSFLKRTESEKGAEEEVQFAGARKKGNCGSLCVSFENKEKFEKACNSMIEAYRMADRFSFSGSQVEGLRILESAINSRKSSVAGLEGEISNRTHRDVYHERDSQEYTESVQTERKSGTSNVKEERKGPRSPSKLRYHIENPSKSAERRSSPTRFEQSFSKVTLGRGSEGNQNFERKFLKQNSKETPLHPLIYANFGKQDRRIEEENSSPEHESMVKDDRYHPELEESARYDNSFEVAQAKKEISDQFLRRNNSVATLETRQGKTQGKGRGLMECETVFAPLTQSQNKSNHCSPNFKENIDK